MSRTKNFMMNHRGDLKLHFRVFLPSQLQEDSNEIDSVVFWVPGYTAHVNRNEMKSHANIINSQRRAFFMLDMMGHGYSEGTRALVPDFQDMVNDVLDFISNMMSLSLHLEREGKSINDETFHCEDLDSSVFSKLKGKDYYIMGQSMGGAVATLVSIELQKKGKMAENFRGAILLAPALEASVPHWLVVKALEYTVVQIAPEASMPPWLSKVNDNSYIFSTRELIESVEKDSWGSEDGGLCWGRPMRWGTALMFIKMFAHLKEHMSEMSSPFLIIHDPDEQICDIKGSYDLMAFSKTPDNSKELVEVPGYLHALISNYPSEILEIAGNWISKQQNARGVTSRANRFSNPASTKKKSSRSRSRGKKDKSNIRGKTSKSDMSN